MLLFFNIFVILICTFFAFKSYMKIKKARYGILHLLCVVFWGIQVVPIVVDYFNDLSVFAKWTPYLYYSMTNDVVAYVYGLFCISTMWFLYLQGNKQSRYRNFLFKNSNFSYSKILKFSLCILMYIPLIGVMFAPTPEIYSHFAYFYTNFVPDFSIERIYHNKVILYLNYISFFSIIGSYYLSNKNSKINSILIVLAIIIDAWIDGKKALFAFTLLAIIMIDFVKLGEESAKKLIKKSFFFLIIVLVFSFSYSSITKKDAEKSSYETYNGYFNREGEVKMAIYSRVIGPKMVEYDGQSLLYNLTFFVPRTVWKEKPVGFFNYLTSYAYYGNPKEYELLSNFQVNIWSEFIANLGIIGYLLSLLFISKISFFSEKSESLITNIVGTIFLILYMFFGFELMVMILFFLWLFLVLKY